MTTQELNFKLEQLAFEDWYERRIRPAYDAMIQFNKQFHIKLDMIGLKAVDLPSVKKNHAFTKNSIITIELWKAVKEDEVKEFTNTFLLAAHKTLEEVTNKNK